MSVIADRIITSVAGKIKPIKKDVMGGPKWRITNSGWWTAVPF